MDVSLLKLRFVLQLDVVRPARVATMAGSDRSHRFQGRDPEETLPQAGVEMVRLVTAGGGCQARDYGGRGEEGVSDARPGSAGRRSRGRQGRVIMRVFLCCGLMSIVGHPASVTRTLSFCRNERRGAKRPVGRPAFRSGASGCKIAPPGSAPWDRPRYWI